MNTQPVPQRLLILVSLFLLGSAALSAQTPLRSDSLGFSVVLPRGYEVPSPEVEPISSDVGTMQMTMWRALGADGNSICMVAVTDYPREMYEMIQSQGNYAAATKALLDSATNGGLRSLNNAKLISRKDFSLNGAQGRSIRLQTTQMGRKIYGRFDYFISENRLYQVAYLAANKKAVDAAATASYFQSFKLMPAVARGTTE